MDIIEHRIRAKKLQQQRAQIEKSVGVRMHQEGIHQDGDLGGYRMDDAQLVRSTYFSIADEQVRKELIRIDRELCALDRSRRDDWAEDAAKRLKSEQVRFGGWWLYASIIALALINTGYLIFLVPGAISGLAIALLLGREMEADEARRRLMRISELEPQAREADRISEEFADNDRFSSAEATTGNPDH